MKIEEMMNLRNILKVKLTGLGDCFCMVNKEGGSVKDNSNVSYICGWIMMMMVYWATTMYKVHHPLFPFTFIISLSIYLPINHLLLWHIGDIQYYIFQVYSVGNWQFYTYCNTHNNKCSYHMSQYSVITILLIIFLML